MRQVYSKFVLALIERANIEITKSTEEFTNEILNEGKCEKITYYIANILEEVSNRIFINLTEKHIQFLYYALLFRDKKINVICENETKGRYIDIVFTSKIFREKIEKYSVMIEIKYIKEKDYTYKLYKEKINEGKQQLKEYVYFETPEEKLKKYLIIFVGKKVKLLEEIK